MCSVRCCVLVQSCSSAFDGKSNKDEPDASPAVTAVAAYDVALPADAIANLETSHALANRMNNSSELVTGRHASEFPAGYLHTSHHVSPHTRQWMRCQHFSYHSRLGWNFPSCPDKLSPQKNVCTHEKAHECFDQNDVYKADLTVNIVLTEHRIVSCQSNKDGTTRSRRECPARIAECLLSRVVLQPKLCTQGALRKCCATPNQNSQNKRPLSGHDAPSHLTLSLHPHITVNLHQSLGELSSATTRPSCRCACQCRKWQYVGP